MRELRVPKVNNNDASYILVEWYVSDGEPVASGDAVAAVETSKANEDLVAAEGGVLHQLVSERTECPVGGLIGYVFDSEEERLAFVAADVSTAAHPQRDLVITAPAQALMRELGLRPDDLRDLPTKVIKRADVERVARHRPSRAAPSEPSGPATQPGTETHRQSRTQRAVAAVVTQAHSTIPAAFAAVDVLDETAAAARRAHGANVGVTALLLKALGALRAAHPLCFGVYLSGEVVVSDGAHVAVTFDVGHGLYLPVVRDVQHRGVAELAEELHRLHARARTGAFAEADLTGANIGLSLHTYQGVVAAYPLITPGQVVMLSLCATRPELALGRDGAVVRRSVFQLGMAYDHRVVNGRDAVIFLRAIKSYFERADRVETLLRDEVKAPFIEA
jgi:2-oxoglutarate dehydrogenase E2 component (dihydrolipoamide succinyltransferase)